MKMMGGGFGLRAALAAAVATTLTGQIALAPTYEENRRLAPKPSRKDKRKAKRRAEHARHIRGAITRRGNKLGRRLRRNAQLGRAGAY